MNTRTKTTSTIAAGAIAATLALTAGLGARLTWPAAYAAPNAPADIQPAPITQDQQSLAAIQPSQEVLANLYDQVLPSVVNIQVTLNPDSIQADSQLPAIPGFPFGDEQQQPQVPQNMPSSEGSGFVYSADGYVVTNNHVVADAEKIVVNFANGVWAKAELIARDPQADLAVIKITPPEGMTLKPLALAPNDGLRVGYSVAAVGSPFSMDQSLTTGIVSALGRAYQMGEEGIVRGPTYSLPDVIQTDTAINPGNSGGPLLNLKGEVVGVNFAINSPVRANSGVGFAIPVNVVRKVVPALIEKGGYEYSYLGLSGQTVTAWLAEEQSLSDNSYGVYVGDVPNSGPSATAGLQANDIVTAIDDQPVRRFEDLLSYLFDSTTPGKTVKLYVLRDGKEVTLDVTLGVRPSETQLAQNEQPETQVLPLAKAIEIAKGEISGAGLMSEFDSANAKRSTINGQPVWIVTLTGEGKSATATIDAQTGDVLGLEVK